MTLRAEMQKTVKSAVQKPNRQSEGFLENILDAITAPQLESLAVQRESDVGHLGTVFVQPNIVGVGIAGKISQRKNKNVEDAITTPQLKSSTVQRQSDVGHLRTVFVQPNIVGVGIAEKISHGKNTGKLSVTFYVEKKIPLNKLVQSSVIPATIPTALSGRSELLTDVVELGKIVLQSGGPFVQRTPIQPGNSVGHFKATAGTLGAIVRRGRRKMILSNSHVLALSGKAKKGDHIIYPGRADKGKVPGDVVAKLFKDVKFMTGGQFVNEVDCALAEISPQNVRPINPSLRGLAGPSGVTVPRRRMKVRISGRTSGVSIQSEIKDPHFRFKIPYPDLGAEVGFKNQILCRPPYSLDGDSGSLVVEASTGRAVGLHFAAAPKGSVSCPIEKVMSKLGCRLELASPPTRQKKAKQKAKRPDKMY